MLKVYFAGPDIFRSDYETHKILIRNLCAQAGIEPLFPDDNNQTDPQMIFFSNIGLIKEADAVIANLNPFRSDTEPDSGTSFECGLAFALDKIIIGYLADFRPMIDKIGDNIDSVTGTTVENFNLPVNLMLAQCGDLVASVEEAILTVCKIDHLPQA